MDPLLHFVGRTNANFTDKVGKATVRDASKFIDRAAPEIRAAFA